MDLKLLVDVPHVKRDRINAHTQLGGGSLVVVSIDQQFQQAPLVRSQLIIGLFRWSELSEESYDAPRNLGRHRRASSYRFLQAFEQPRGWRLLEQVSARARAERFKDPLVIAVHCQH